jgi:two-component system, chemotaxis family, response regulator Rcp1
MELSESLPTSAPEGAVILLVEDHLADVRSTRDTLRKEKLGNELYVLPNGVEALAFLRRKGVYAGAPRADLVLLDLNLLRRGGWEAFDEIKGDPALRAIPVVVVAASRAEADACRALQRDAAGFVIKPVDLTQLAHIVQGCAELWLTMVLDRPEVPPLC